MRIGVIGCFHETNTFAPGCTETSDFQKEWYVGKQAFYDAYQGTKTSMGGAIDSSEEFGYELIPLFYTQTLPSAMVTDEAFETIRLEMMEQLAKEADGLDGILVIMHGAMASEGCQDVESEYLKEIGNWMGEKPISVTIDMHANISDQMIERCDFIVGYDTYPHIDAYERAMEACRLLMRCILNEVRPIQYLAKANVLIAPTLMNTNMTPMNTLMNQAFEIEKDEQVLNVTIAGGFAFADVHCAGITIVVTTDKNAEKAKSLAEHLALWFWDNKEEFRPKLYPIGFAYERIMHSGDYPAILIESSDNVGGGSPADATHVLRYLLEKKVPKFLMVVSDYEAVYEAFHKKVGERYTYMVGGKTDRRYGHEPLHGEPVRLKGTIRLVSDGVYKHEGPYMSGMKASMGKTAVIEMDDTESVVILTEKRVAPWDINHVRSVGIDPEAFRVIVVKAAVAWRAAFGSIAKQALELDTPGCCSSNLSHFPYQHVRSNVEIIGGS